MKKIIYLKYGELCLKGKNRKAFSKIAFDNLKYSLSNFSLVYEKKFDYVTILGFNDENLEDIIEISKRVPGFCNLSIANICEKNLDIIKEKAASLITNEATFKIEARRSDKTFYIDSQVIKLDVANYILNKVKIKVDIHNPEIKITIEIKREYAVIYSKKIECANGLPIGSNGKVLLLLSGGIDSCVAAHLLMNRGLKVDFITFITPPHTSPESLQKVKDLINIITLDSKLQSSKLFVCNFTKVQDELTHIEKESYRITLLRRSFFRISEKLLISDEYNALATGDAIGQVASQTLDSMLCITSAIKSLVLRPLLTYDKNDIIKIAKKIKTFETSILPFEDSCSLFAPKNPITKPKMDKVEFLEFKMELLESIEELVYNKIEIINFNKKNII